jgi:hypothetical protein
LPPAVTIFRFDTLEGRRRREGGMGWWGQIKTHRHYAFFRNTSIELWLMQFTRSFGSCR